MRLHHLIDLLDTKHLRKAADKYFAGLKLGADKTRVKNIIDMMDQERQVLKFMHPDTPQFDLGNIYDELSDEDHKELTSYSINLIEEDQFKPQYEKMCMSFFYARENLMIVSGNTITNEYQFYIMQKIDGLPFPDGISFRVIFGKNGMMQIGDYDFIIDRSDKIDEKHKSWADSAVGAYLCLVALLNAEGVIVERKAAPKFINNQRLKKGKSPIGDIHEIKIVVGGKRFHYSGEADEDRAKGSPKRMHWRRGHIRRLANGTVVNIRPCLVGTVGEPPKSKPEYSVQTENKGRL